MLDPFAIRSLQQTIKDDITRHQFIMGLADYTLPELCREDILYQIYLCEPFVGDYLLLETIIGSLGFRVNWDSLRRASVRIAREATNTMHPKPNGVYTGSQFTQYIESLPPRDWLIDGFLARGMYAILGGPAKTYKSTFARYMCRSLLLGEKFFDRETEPRRVMYMPCEEDPRQFHHDFITILGADMPDNLFVLQYGGQWTNRFQLWQDIENYVAEYEIDILICDPLMHVMYGVEINSYDQVYTFSEESPKRIARDYNCCIMALHHTTKPDASGRQSFLGSSAFQAVTDVNMETRKEKEPRKYLDDDKLVTLETAVRGGLPFPKYVLEYNGDGYFLPRSWSEIQREADNQGNNNTNNSNKYEDHLLEIGQIYNWRFRDIEDWVAACSPHGKQWSKYREAAHNLLENGEYPFNNE